MSNQLGILIIGSGGREHALAWKAAQSPRVAQVWVAPGNGGTASAGQDKRMAPIANVDLAETDVEALIRFAHQETVYLTIVGPEVPLAAGIVDALQAAGVRCFGPLAAAAKIEASKSFAKSFMARHQIPTAHHQTFTDYDMAMAYLQTVDHAVVIKASGLAAGKGVIVPETKVEAEQALHQIMQEQLFGSAGLEVVIEERLYGQEASVIAFCDGVQAVPMPPAQDHKPIFTGDHGPNTGGMGAYTPVPLISDNLLAEIQTTILQPVVDGLRTEGSPFIGFLFAGLMLTENGPRVIEYNCRFGDPEAQVILPLLKSDLIDIIESCLDGTLSETLIEWRAGAAAAVVAVSEGYPGSYPKGRIISGVDVAQTLENVVVFQAGTHQAQTNTLVTSGGRVLAVTGLGADLPAAIAQAYAGIDKIHFEGIYFRPDIGAKALAS